jgi:hypothetical protein
MNRSQRVSQTRLNSSVTCLLCSGHLLLCSCSSLLLRSSPKSASRNGGMQRIAAASQASGTTTIGTMSGTTVHSSCTGKCCSAHAVVRSLHVISRSDVLAQAIAATLVHGAMAHRCSKRAPSCQPIPHLPRCTQHVSGTQHVAHDRQLQRNI